MKRVELAPGVFHLQSGSNLGLLVENGQALLIDTGLDDDAGRRALRIVEEQNAELVGIVITHAHADHFGGAQYLQRRLGTPVYAADLEAAMMEHPIIEPLYLFGGAAPIEALRQKFTLAEPCRVDKTVGPGPLEVGPFELSIVPLPGHALNQVGVGVETDGNRVLFCADAVFPQATIEKHKVLFCVDLEQTVETIEGLADEPYDCFAPGHGPAYAAGAEIEAVCEANRARLEEIRDVVHDALGTPQETSALVQHTAEHFGLRITRATAYYLTRTTVLAALSALERGGSVRAAMAANKLVWERV